MAQFLVHAVDGRMIVQRSDKRPNMSALLIEYRVCGVLYTTSYEVTDHIGNKYPINKHWNICACDLKEAT